MTDQPKSTMYHAYAEGSEWYLGNSTDRELEKWATDPNCYEAEVCARALTARRNTRDSQPMATTRVEVTRGFDPRTEISADARHVAGRIVKHLWIICVALPLFVGLALLLLGMVK